MTKGTYFGAYAQADIVSQEDSKHLSSNESVIGSEVMLNLDPADATTADATPTEDTPDASSPDSGYALVSISSKRGYSLGSFDEDTSKQLLQAHKSGMVCRAFLSAVIYSDSRGAFWGEYAIFCYPAEQKEIWERFCNKAMELISKGDHPNIKLTDKEIARVVSSNGEWADMREMQFANLEKGALYFKKKRSVSDSLVESAVSGNKGCRASAYIFYVVLALIIGAIIMHFFF